MAIPQRPITKERTTIVQYHGFCLVLFSLLKETVDVL